VKCLIDTPTVAGQVGSLITYLDRVLCVGEVIVETSGPTFTDRTAEARLEGGTAFNLLAATTENVFVGYDDTFNAIRFKKGTGGTTVTITVEYWNGSAWTAVSGLADGTSGFSADGELTWTRPTRAAWAKNTVNGGPSMYHVRVKTSTTPGVTPTAEFFTINWTIYDGSVATNEKVYKSIGENGTEAIYIHIRDNSQRPHADGSATAACAVMFTYETWDAVAHNGTGQCPTSFSNDGYGIGKSNTADATARSVTAFVSRNLVVLGIFTGTEASSVNLAMFGKLSGTHVAGDAFATFIAGVQNFNRCGVIYQNTVTDWGTGAAVGWWVQRAYTGTGAATAAGPMPYGPLASGAMPNALSPFPNGPDSSLRAAEFVMIEANRHVRGTVPELLAVLHDNAASFSPTGADTFTRPSDGKKFRIIRAMNVSITTITRWVAFEDHD
jgi:hypothetical protein